MNTDVKLLKKLLDPAGPAAEVFLYLIQCYGERDSVKLFKAGGYLTLARLVNGKSYAVVPLNSRSNLKGAFGFHRGNDHVSIALWKRHPDQSREGVTPMVEVRFGCTAELPRYGGVGQTAVGVFIQFGGELMWTGGEFYSIRPIFEETIAAVMHLGVATHTSMSVGLDIATVLADAQRDLEEVPTA